MGSPRVLEGARDRAPLADSLQNAPLHLIGIASFHQHALLTSKAH